MISLKSLNLNFVIVLILLSIIDNAWVSAVSLETKLGPIKGIKTEVLGKPHYRFLGVPYALPPVGDLRFQPPKPIVAWKKEMVLARFKPSCPQIFNHYPFSHRVDPRSDEAQQSEDCLYLNIYTPNIQTDRKLPVFLFVHEGALEFSSGANWQGQVLSQHQNIVVITFNFRLGAFGFLTGFDDKNREIVIEPNLGFLDQMVALKWVYNNIDDYGGDPNQITLGGNSAGAMAVGYHILMRKYNPDYKRYFSRAILMSGTALTTGGAHLDLNRSTQILNTMLTELNCPNSTKSVILECLMSKSTDRIMAAQSTLLLKHFMPFNLVNHKNMFENDTKMEMEAGEFHLDEVMIGTVSDEGLYYLQEINKFISDGGIDEKVYQKSIDIIFSQYADPIREAIKFQYKDHYHPYNRTQYRESLFACLSDAYAIAPAAYAANQFSKFGVTTYQYHFDFRTKESDYFKPEQGVAKTMELTYLFGYPFEQPFHIRDKYSFKDKIVSKLKMNLWGNFIKAGKPAFPSLENEWLPYDNKTQFYYYIGENVELRQRRRANNVAFWNSMIPILTEALQEPTVFEEEFIEEFYEYPPTSKDSKETKVILPKPKKIKETTRVDTPRPSDEL
ncbi:uncharacterized protein TRIADDRAFT_61115 [Trichoplax adhaerens]|uniref:Carboxylesterase type B domain-containing protein n=1 Tax=Trichoplax adhaerens TaxID=10228 RepID=B3SA31_TRIAD|nr:hypothetical protein TRIADDRAFT_61115 [Trichoplax adhaerens]EDV20446.1 hypothetical protein TRIADDRAFT_61115 [Trichoplax adhaerens]|eukprot:XP_002117140.1 hypothetical protein TRIADDRAFT_61115 [Trichoplax adhaerens]